MLYGRTKDQYLVKDGFSRMCHHSSLNFILVDIAFVPAQSISDCGMEDGMIIGD